MKKKINPNQKDMFIQPIISDIKSEPKAFRVWNTINPPNKPIHYKVLSINEASAIIQKLEKLQRNNDSIDISVFGLEVKYEKEWEEWMNDMGDIHQYIKGKIQFKPSEKRIKKCL